MMHRIHGRVSMIALFGAFAFLAPATVGAQRVSELPVGARLRVETDSAKIIGNFENASSDSIKVRTRLDLRALPLGGVRSIWVSTGPGRARGMLKAGVPAGIIGALAGAGLSYLTWQKCRPGGIVNCQYTPDTRSEATVRGGAAIGAMSFVIASVVGAIRGSETWAPVTFR